ncbi:MAG: hypothetical protein ACRDWE_06055, partial [Acidimicrobiales bacterium]
MPGTTWHVRASQGNVACAGGAVAADTRCRGSFSARGRRRETRREAPRGARLDTPASNAATVHLRAVYAIDAGTYVLSVVAVVCMAAMPPVAGARGPGWG